MFATVPFAILGATFTMYPYMWIFEQNKNEALLGDALRRPIAREWSQMVVSRPLS